MITNRCKSFRKHLRNNNVETKEHRDKLSHRPPFLFTILASLAQNKYKKKFKTFLFTIIYNVE